MREETELVSTIEERPQAAPTAIPHDYSKRMMVFGGRSSMELAAKVAGKLDLDLGQVTLKTFANGEVYCRYEESIRGADVFLVQSTCANEQSGMTPNDALIELLTMIDAAQGASAHRIIAVHALVRLRPPGQEVGPARADHGPHRRQVPGGRRRRPRPHHGPPRRPGAGLLPRPGRPHDGDADADPVVRRPAPRPRSW